jgi:RHS repeat-associated protein
LEYSYDLNGARTELEDTDNKDTTYTRDKAGRISSMTDAAGQVTTYTYKVDGLLERQVNVNGTSVDYGYDNERRLTSVINRRGVSPSDPVISEHYWTYDVAGNRTRLVERRARVDEPTPRPEVPNVLPSGRVTGGSGAPAAVPTSRVSGGTGSPAWLPTRTPPALLESITDYVYDKLNRVLTATTAEAGGSSTVTFEYDRVGNRTKVIYGSGGYAQTTTFTYDKADRITGSETTGAGQQPLQTLFQWTANGNLIVRGETTMTYDRANRLKSIAEGGVTTTFEFTARNRIVRRTVGSEVTTFTQDIGGRLPVVIGQSTTTNGVTTTRERFARGPSGLSHSTNRLQNDVVSEVMHKDAKGSIHATSGPGGGSTQARVLNTYRYDTYGKLLGQEGSSKQPFGYTGQQNLTGSTIHLRARAYDPSSAVFLQRDRYAGRLSNPLTLNRYAYTLGNPVSHSDPSGRNTDEYSAGADYSTTTDLSSDAWSETGDWSAPEPTANNTDSSQQAYVAARTDHDHGDFWDVEPLDLLKANIRHIPREFQHLLAASDLNRAMGLTPGRPRVELPESGFFQQKTIQGVTDHAIDAYLDGVITGEIQVRTLDDLSKAITNPVFTTFGPTDEQGLASVVFIGDHISFAVNENGWITTVYNPFHTPTR